ncbi:hypothetical protein WN55_00388 [Dufourea novaeangliae]|uniref:Uncharacterized protein n=1 Tax=Dufourea novaeangliae TaxID=178035 RepID=A0A154PFH9_DUFNO|nr:hypothetical protein WN55_00388 [Dufourea novaeangliae]
MTQQRRGMLSTSNWAYNCEREHDTAKIWQQRAAHLNFIRDYTVSIGLPSRFYESLDKVQQPIT